MLLLLRCDRFDETGYLSGPQLLKLNDFANYTRAHGMYCFLINEYRIHIWIDSIQFDSIVRIPYLIIITHS